MFLTACAQNTTVDSSQKVENSVTNITQSTLPPISIEAIKHIGVISILTTDIKNLWTQDFDHYQADLLINVSDAITYYAQQGNLSSPELSKLSYYLRIYSSLALTKTGQKIPHSQLIVH